MSPVDWQEFSDHSDDDTVADPRPVSRKRSSRACDQCRKTKSKCERPSDQNSPCKSCVAAGLACTFLGPSYKRGPPKGYINAIEQRWREVEALLAAIIRCPDRQVQRLFSALSRDPTAFEIIRKVREDPFGQVSSCETTADEFFVSTPRTSDEAAIAPESVRSRRQSRLSREIVSSNQENDLSLLPENTKEWQDRLSDSVLEFFSNPQEEGFIQQKWDEMSITESGSDEVDHAVDAIGGLALDENLEVRYHGETSGLHILSRNFRTDDHNASGLWRLPRAGIWPGTMNSRDPLELSISISLPPIHQQDRLVALYFDYIHPIFPIFHKELFLLQYNLWKQRGNSSSNLSLDSATSFHRDSSQEITPVLLCSIFSITCRFCDDMRPPGRLGQMWEAGSNYSASAKTFLIRNFHQSRPSSVQSLLLLGFREFGMGSMEQAWSLVGMAMRMAMDLGLNCDSSKWKIKGKNLFSPADTQIRCQIWWCCCIVDRYGSLYLGRPIVLKDHDFDTPLPTIDHTEDQLLWPSVSQAPEPTYSPSQSWTSSCIKFFSSLTLISGSIVTHIYPVRRATSAIRKSAYMEIGSRLDQWFIDLPKELQFDPSSGRSRTPPPHILFLNLRYWAVVLMLNRAFIPSCKRLNLWNATELAAFERAQSAANQISFIATSYRETFSLKRVSPFLPSTILAASIMHLLTLTLRQSVHATLGFQQCMSALQSMQTLWPSAARAWELLNGVSMRSDDIFYSPSCHIPSGFTETAEIALVTEQRDDHDNTFNDPIFKPSDVGHLGVQQLGSRIMSHVLGIDIPDVEPSYFPAYEWWPRSYEDSPPHQLTPVEAKDAPHSTVMGPPSSGLYPNFQMSGPDQYSYQVPRQTFVS